MSPEQLFDSIVEHYHQASRIVKPYDTNGNVFRDRQHSISSVLEDLVAYFLSNWVKIEFPGIPICFMVDYAIRPDSKEAFLYPDIAIIVEQENKPPRLVSYLDVKTDLGYKRDYFNQLSGIAESITRVRESANIGKRNSKNEYIMSANNLVWRTIVLSDQNISKEKLEQNKKAAEQYSNLFKLYFLSGKKHPNRKLRNLIKIHDDQFKLLLYDISNDIKQNLT